MLKVIKCSEHTEFKVQLTVRTKNLNKCREVRHVPYEQPNHLQCPRKSTHVHIVYPKSYFRFSNLTSPQGPNARRASSPPPGPTAFAVLRRMKPSRPKAPSISASAAWARCTSVRRFVFASTWSRSGLVQVEARMAPRAPGRARLSSSVFNRCKSPGDCRWAKMRPRARWNWWGRSWGDKGRWSTSRGWIGGLLLARGEVMDIIIGYILVVINAREFS